PALFAIQVGLSELWRSWGICPDAVVGHSLGEIAAAHVAGVLTLEDAVSIIFHRSRLQHKTEGKGRMLAASVSYQNAKIILAQGYEDIVSIAAINSPNSVTFSGDSNALKKIEQKLIKNDIFCRFLNVNVPYHSSVMEPLKSELVNVLKDISPQSTNIPFFSTVTGQILNGSSLLPEYWGANMRQTVMFSGAVQNMIKKGYNIFIEISAHPVLGNSVSESLSVMNHNAKIVPSLIKTKPERETMLGSFSDIYKLGYPVDWNYLFPDKAPYIRLPNYPWQKERHWVESEESRQYRLGGVSRQIAMGQKRHILLGNRLNIAMPIWDSKLDRKQISYLYDHKIQGSAVFPGAAYIEMALAAAHELLDNKESSNIMLENIEFNKAIFLSDEEDTNFQFMFNTDNKTFDIYSSKANNSNSWDRNATGKITYVTDLNLNKNEALSDILKRCIEEVSGDICYQNFKKIGFEYGQMFQGLKKLHFNQSEAIGSVMLNNIANDFNTYYLYPALLDSCFHVMLGFVSFNEKEQSNGTWLPVKVEAVHFYEKPNYNSPLHVHAFIKEQEKDKLKSDLILFDESETILAEIKGLEVMYIDSSEIYPDTDYLFQHNWEQHTKESKLDDSPGTWLILSDKEDFSKVIAEELEIMNKTIVLSTQNLNYPNLQGILFLFENNSCSILLDLIKKLADVEWKNYPNLWIVTLGSQAVEETDYPSLELASLWGLGRVISNEYPDFKCKMIDLSKERYADDIILIIEELLSGDKEDEIAFRNGYRYVNRLNKIPEDILNNNSGYKFSQDSTVLVTGGFSGFGLATAEWLAENGVRNLALMGRSGASSENAKKSLEILKKSGVNVMVAKADVSNLDQVSKVLMDIELSMPPLKGIIHAANVYDDAALIDMTYERFKNVMGPKALGALNLHNLTLNNSLDFFVLFSSISSVIGNPGQGNYVAANSYLDALANYRFSLNLPGLSVNWGAIEDVGYLERNNEIKAHLKKMGVKMMPAKKALNILGKLIELSAVNVTAAYIDWSKWASFNQSETSMRFGNLIESKTEESEQKFKFLDQLKSKPINERKEALKIILTNLVAEVLGIKQLDYIDSKRGFTELGMDSILTLELRNRLQKGFGCTMPATLIFKYPNIEKLLKYFIEEILCELFEVSSVKQDENADITTHIIDEIEQLSEDEAEALLIQELANLNYKN
ncbi:MAG: SDR family NAD(P)-dependent oxidoreductase, partial [Desulfobacterales bacterium]|nr:SDR family NAD(P)-dependent oxidoreductase [Desulfobacterales bacterium]